MARLDLNQAITNMPNRTNAWWFFIALFGGGAGIWWIKSAFVNAWFAAGFAAGVVFALTIYYIRNNVDAPEEEGDNVYYLGLLFTLLSLMLTLVELFGVDFEAVPEAEKIRTLLGNFGIALTSTILGIAGRVAVLNWQLREPAERPGLAEDTVVPPLPDADASTSDLEKFNRHVLGMIARDLTQGANALARFHRIVRTHASESEEKLLDYSEALKRESTAFKDTLQSNAKTFAEELKSHAASTLDSVGGSLSAVAKQAEALLGRVEYAHNSYLSEVRSASDESLNALRQNFDAAAKQAITLPGSLRSAHDGYLAEVSENVRSFQDEIRSASGQTLDVLRRNFDAATKQTLSLAQNVSTAHEKTDEAVERLGAGLGHANDASAAFANSAHQAAKSTTVLELEVDKLHTALAKVHPGAEAISGVLDAMSDLEARIRAGVNADQAAVMQQIGETLQTITAQGAAATEQAANAAEFFNVLAQSVRTTESETRRAAEALRVLADVAETRAETLGQRQDPRGIRRLWKQGS